MSEHVKTRRPDGAAAALPSPFEDRPFAPSPASRAQRQALPPAPPANPVQPASEARSSFTVHPPTQEGHEAVEPVATERISASGPETLQRYFVIGETEYPRGQVPGAIRARTEGTLSLSQRLLTWAEDAAPKRFDTVEAAVAAAVQLEGNAARADVEDEPWPEMGAAPAPAPVAVEADEGDEYEVIGKVTIERNDITALQELEDNDFYKPDEDSTGEVVAKALFAQEDREFTSGQEWKTEITMRVSLIEAMNTINSIETHGYNFETDDWSLPAAQWDSSDIRVQGGRKQTAGFRARAGVTASDAIDSIFSDVQDEAVLLDCSTAIIAVHYKALRDVLGNASFDATYGRGRPREAIISPAGAQVRVGRGAMGEAPIFNEVETLTVETIDELIPGDWVYFQNFSDYDATHEGAAAVWAGEHALFLGNGNYEGFGASKSLENMVEALITQYNNRATLKRNKPTKEDKEESAESLTGELPGPLKEIRRLKNPHRARR